MSGEDLSSFSMLDLFRTEVDHQAKVLTTGLLALERSNQSAEQIEILMRAAHSLKGAARIVDLGAAVQVAHAMEDCFVTAQKRPVTLGQRQIDLLLSGVDLLVKISQTAESDAAKWEAEQKGEIDSFIAALTPVLEGHDKGEPPATEPKPFSSEKAVVFETVNATLPDADRVLRVTADHLNRVLGLASESLVESRRLAPFANSLLRLKRQYGDLVQMLNALIESLPEKDRTEQVQMRVFAIQNKATECRQVLTDRLADLEVFDQRSTNLSHRLYEQALACRMRPFADGIHGFPRIVRDIALSLGKKVKLEIIGEMVSVDRDMLEKLEAPLIHLLQNAVDHGVEFPDDRRQAGKPDEGLVRLDVRHNAGMLQVTVFEDGRGIDPEVLRRAVVKRELVNAETAAKLSEMELFEFLFLPGFSMKETVTKISGRGMGLDVVKNMVKQVRGTVRVFSEVGKGTRFQLQLPLSLSVVRTLLVDIGGESYAFPLAHITRTLKLPKTKIEVMEGRQHFDFDGRQIGLVTAHQVLDLGGPNLYGDELPVIIVEDHGNFYGVVVDRFLGERELVVHPLDPRLGKIKDVSTGALMEDGSPGLIIDVEDLVHSIDKLITRGVLSKVSAQGTAELAKKRKRVLIVDDSLTVRELERKLLRSHGYEVEAALDGMDGWNAVRTGNFDLVISDVDMPRMDGIELVTLIKKDINTKSLPVMIISYKDREEDRQRGLEAGADYYLAKGSFHDEALLNAVKDMIGEATP
jgi:two-component system, chemotaxis family, sensor histidine kinase and response regulator WspE